MFGNTRTVFQTYTHRQLLWFTETKRAMPLDSNSTDIANYGKWTEQIFINNVVLFAVNLKGILFWNEGKGGYVQQLKDIKAEKYRLNLLNIIIALGTGLAGLYALVQFFVWLVAQIKKICS